MTKNYILTIFVLLTTIVISNAQLTGTKTIPGTYATIALAVADLNAQGVGAGGVTFNIAAGYTETETAPISVTATGTAGNLIVFQKSGVGANPLITSYTGGVGTPATAVQDGIFNLVGSDYVTITSIDLAENPANIANPATMEYGYGLFKTNATDGCQNVIIQNCTITLNRINNVLGSGPAADGSIGIDVLNAIPTAATTTLTVTAASGTHSNNKFYSNTIQNCNIGIALIGFAAATPFTNADTGNDVGGASAATGNIIRNFGGGAAGTNPAAGVRTLAQYGLNVSFNTINSNDGGGVNHLGILRGIFINTATSANSTINNNTISVKGGGTTQQITGIENVAGSTAAANTISMNNNTISNCTYTTATSGVFYGIYNNAASPATLNINNNIFSNNSCAATSGSYYCFYNTGAVTTTINMNNNSINGVTLTAATTSLSFRCLMNTSGVVGTTTTNINNNTFQNIVFSGTAVSGEFEFIYSTGSNLVCNISTNSLIGSHTNPTTGTTYLIYNNTSSPTVNITNNTLTGTSFIRTASTGTFYGYYNFGSPSSGTSTISGNNYSNVTLSGSISGYGIYQATSTTQVEKIMNNTFSNYTIGTGSFVVIHHNYGAAGSENSGNIISNINGTGSLTGIQFGNATASLGMNVFNNNINTISSTGAALICGMIHTSGNSTNIYKNKIYGIQVNNAGGSVNGLQIAGGVTVNIYNNLIGDLKAPLTSSASDAIRGINIITTTSSSTINVAYNTVSLNATSSGANFSTSALFHTYSGTSTTATLNMGDNILVNNSTPRGTGLTVAFRRSASTDLNNYGSISNNNLFFAGGTSCASNLIYYDGTNSSQTLAAFQALVAPRESASKTEDPKFVSTVGSSSTFLHINPAVPTQIESGGATVAGITDDYDGDIRNVTTPDIGADEFTGTISTACNGTPSPGVAAASPSIICSGFSTNICLTGQSSGTGITIQWRSAVINGGPYTDIPCAAGNCFNTGALNPGTYYYVAVVTCASGTSAQSNQVTVTVNTSPTVTISPLNPNLCSGLSITETASGGISYLWNTGAITPSITVTPLVSTTYSVTATDAIGCTNTTSSTVTVIPSPIVTTTATPPNICVGGTSQLQANVGFTAAQYGFSASSGTTLDPMIGSTQVIGTSDDDTPTAAPVNIGFTFNYEGVNYTQYSVSPDGWILLGGATAVSQFTNAVTSSTNVPKIYPYWDDLATGVDGNVQVLVSGSAPNRIFIVQWFVTVPRNTAGNANSTFQAWLYETSNKIEFRYGTMGVPTSGSISGGITGATSTNFNSITYSTNTSSSTTANDVNTIAPPLGTKYTYLPPAYTYSWSPATFLNSTTISNPIASNVTVTTTYIVTVTNTVTGCSSTSSVTVTADPPANITGNLSICFGSSTTLTASGGTSYLWSTGANTAAITVSPSISTTYTVTVTNSVTGCTAAISRLVTVNPLPVITLTPSADVTICSGSSQTITATGGGTYLWSTGAITAGITVSPVITTTYTVTVTTGAGCTGVASRTVNVIPGVNITTMISNQPTTCASNNGGINLFVNSGIGPFTFNWATPDGSGIVPGLQGQQTLSVGSYFVTVTSANGCTATSSQTLNGPGNCGLCPTMGVSLTVNGSVTQNVCAGANFTMVNDSLTSMGVTYGIIFKYYPTTVADPYTGGTVLATVPNGSLTSLGTIATAIGSIPTAGTYTLYAILTPSPTNPVCRPFSRLTLTVNPNPVTNPVANQTYCLGSTVPAIVFTSPTPGAFFSWTRTGEAIGAALAGSGSVPSFVTTNAGTSPLTSTFTVTASFTAGGQTCFGTPITFTITVNPNPTVNQVANQTYCVGSTVPSVIFTTPNTGGTVVYNWTRTAGAIGLAPVSGTGNVPSFVATNAGTAPLSSTFSVTESFTNNGVVCTGPTMTFTITINPVPQVNPVTNITTCNNTLTGPINFSSTVPGTGFNWTNNNATIGLGASGTGNIPQFTALNPGTTTIVATITVTPFFTNGGVTCTGTSITFTITITPSPVASCKNATIFLNSSGTATLLTSDINNGSTGGTLSLSKTSFNCSNVGANTVILTVTDGCGKTSTCSAIVTVVDNIPPVINGTIAPSITVQCDATIPTAPTVTATDNCSAVLTFTETSTQSKWLQLCEHYQYVITRLWVAVDPSGNTTTKQQLINVIDNKAPVMTMLPVSFLTAFCDEGEIHGCPIPIDNCDQTPSLLFEFHYEPYLGLDGCTNSYTVIRKWTAGDKCGNTTVITQTIYVVDKEKPELTCPANIVKTSDKPIAVTWTAPKAHDDCDGALTATQIAGPKNGSSFDPGTTTKITYVTVDNCGNTDTCSFFITINKGTTTNTGAKISGAVKNMNGGLIENAEVDINGDVNQFTSTVKGAYEFASITKGSKEKVSVKKSSNPLEGVNTLDLVFITNHILGKKALNSPYKILAADVNNSESITTADLVELRKLILHITDKFANVDSWEFLPTTTTFSSQFNPWKDPIVSDVQIDNIQTDQVADFNGIKMGDVTWDATGTASGAIEVKSNEIYSLKAENKEYRKGDNVEMIVSGKELDGMKGMQFTMEYNPAILEFVSVKGMREDVGEENFGMRYMESGKITGSIDLRGEKLGDDLFKITFKAKETGSLLNSIRMTSSLTKAEAYTKTDESNGLSLSFTQNGKEIANTSAVLYQNEPNPFENNTVIRFFVPENQEATLSIFTLDGKLVKEMNEVYTKGEHQVNVAKEEFPSSGIYYYQLKTNNFTDTKKMMYIK